MSTQVSLENTEMLKLCVFLGFVFLSSALGKTATTDIVIDCNLGHLRSCFKILIAESVVFGMPATAGDAQKQCKNAATIIECFVNYTSTCTSGFMQSIFYGAGSGYPKYFAEYCKPQSPLRLQYLKNATCMNEVYSSDSTISVLRDFIVGLNDCFYRPFSERLLAFGCSYQRWYEDTKKLFESQCGTESVDSLNTYLRIAFHGLPWTLSGHLGPENEKCKRILPSRGQPYIASSTDFGLVRFLNELLEMKKLRNVI